VLTGATLVHTQLCNGHTSGSQTSADISVVLFHAKQETIHKAADRTSKLKSND